MINAILFDFGQTLVDSANGFRAAEKDAKARIFTDLFPEPPADSWGAFLTEYRRLRGEFHRRSDFSRPSIWRAVYRYFKHLPDPAQLKKWETDYWRQVKAHTQPFPETLEVLETLSAKYALALITNTQGQKVTGTHRVALFPEIERFFEMIVVAGESGIPTKPDKKPFLSCLETLGINPDEAIYVGDDFRIDIQGSQAAGLHPVWLKHNLVQRNWPEVKSTVPVITGLNQLPQLVKTMKA